MGVLGSARPPPGAGQAWPREQVVWPAPIPSPSRILASDVFRKNRHFGFCPVQFREYSFSDSPRTKNRQLALWLLLIGYSKKSYEKYSKVGTKHRKVDKTKHGTSKIIDTFTIYQPPPPCHSGPGVPEDPLLLLPNWSKGRRLSSC